jgi:hypothetical protein
MLFMVEHDNSCRIMTVGVDSVLYDIPRRGMGIGQDADLKFQVEFVEFVKFKSWWRLL